jgi:hypothetical protein
MNLVELLRVIDCTEEQRVKYAAYKFSREARQLWYTKRNLLVMKLGSEEAIIWIQFKEEFYREYSWSLRRVYPNSYVPTRNRVGVIDVAGCILRNADQGRICAMIVARWDTSFGTATGPKSMVLVHLEGNNGRTRVKCNHQSC